MKTLPPLKTIQVQSCFSRPQRMPVLFTADAGISALTMAAEFAASKQINLQQLLTKVQVPHHGSKRNVGPTVLNSILGPKTSDDQPERNCYISAAKDGAPKHPSQRVINAFRRRGYRAYGTTNGQILHTHKDAPARNDWVAAPEIPYVARFEEEQ